MVRSYIVCFSAALFFLYTIVQLTFVNVISAGLYHSFHISRIDLSMLGASFLLANAIFHLPGGILYDKYSVRRVTLLILFLNTITTFMLAYTHSFYMACFCRFIAGTASAFSILAGLRMVASWFPINENARMSGLLVSFGMSGGILGGAPFAILVQHFGWRSATSFLGWVGVAFFIFLFVFLHDHPKDIEMKRSLHNSDEKPLSVSNLLLLTCKNRQNWISGLYIALMNLPIFVLAGMWGTSYLMIVHRLTLELSALAISMLFVGIMVGSPALGYLSDRFGKRKPIMLYGAIVSILVALAIMKTHYGTDTAILLFLTYGILITAQVIGYPVIAESNPTYAGSTAQSVASSIVNIVGAVAQPLFGALIVKNSLSAIPNYTMAMWIFPAAFLLAAVLIPYLRETYCRPLSNSTSHSLKN